MVRSPSTMIWCWGIASFEGYDNDVHVTFFKIIGGRKLWLRTYLYGPSGYIGDFATQPRHFRHHGRTETSSLLPMVDEIGRPHVYHVDRVQ